MKTSELTGAALVMIATQCIGGRFTTTPEDQFYADRVSAEMDGDDGEYTYFAFADGSRVKINSDGEIFAAKEGAE